jgi:hypothetical protein
MTSVAKLAQMIEELLPEDQEKVEEYISLLHSKESVLPAIDSELDKQYRDYILQGITEGEADIARGDVYESAEARKRLLKY